MSFFRWFDERVVDEAQDVAVHAERERCEQYRSGKERETRHEKGECWLSRNRQENGEHHEECESKEKRGDDTAGRPERICRELAREVVKLRIVQA
jgi:hypothetical protein